MTLKIKLKAAKLNKPSLGVRLIQDLLGLGLIGASLCLGVALWFYNPLDPSWNTAIEAEVLNPLGAVGAVFADIMRQTCGIVSYVFIVFIGRLGIYVLWGVKLFHLWRLFFYGILGALAILLLSIACEGLRGLALPSGGGIVGLIFFAKLLDLTNSYGLGLAPRWWFFFCGGSGLIFLYIALGIPVGFWDSVGLWVKKGSAWVSKGILGWRKFFSSQDDGDRLQKDQMPRLHHRENKPVLRVHLGNERKEPYSSLMGNSKEKNPPQDEVFFSGVDTTSHQEEVVDAPRVPDSKKNPSYIDLVDQTDYAMPSLDLLRLQEKGIKKAERISDADIQERARELESVLEEFGVRGEINRVRPGPVVTLFELTPAPGIKSSRIVGLSDDIARSMSAVSARVAVIPGQNAIGIELPNDHRETVYLRTLLETEAFERTASRLPLALGKDIGGAPVVVDLARMPHLLVAGTTGSGKSVAINTMILSLLFRLSPEQCKFIMIDPKMLELSVYEGIPHLLAPVVTEPKKAIVALKWVVREMEERYKLMAKLGVRNIDGYNQRLAEALRKGETLSRKVQVGFDGDTGQPLFEEQPLEKSPLPYIVVVVDEMADLMLVAGKEIEAAIQRLAQMARAAGIHIIMATQRPSVDVITGTIKANFPTRISFQVTSKIDSRTILGEQGAEQLLGQGDMLYMAPGGRLSRVHGPFVQDSEVEEVVAYLKSQGMPAYIEDITKEEEGELGEGKISSDDPLYEEAVTLVLREQKASTSFIQRHLQIGYNRAARLVDLMEAEGIISGANHVGKREVLGR